jgi:hypothetical protein
MGSKKATHRIGRQPVRQAQRLADQGAKIMSSTTKFHVLATPTTEDGFVENINIGFAETEAQAVAMCIESGYTVITVGAQVQKYDAEDAPFIFTFDPDGFGAISVPVEPTTLS